jgi:hypothetical protein
MREVDFRYLQGTLTSLNSSTDLVLARGCVKVTLSHQCSPYVSRRGVTYDQIIPIAPGDVLVVANFRNILLVGTSAEAAERATEAVGRAGRPFEDSEFGWDGPWADWVCEPVPPTLHLLRGILRCASEYGLVEPDWLGRALLHVAWLVPVVTEWDEDGRPVFSWLGPPSEPESDPADQDCCTE